MTDKIRRILAALVRPRDWFRCSSCGSGPWHWSWARIETVDHNGRAYVMPREPLGGCCSGAD